MTLNHNDKAIRFRALHEGAKPFVIANAWDGASARILASLGFEALATLSGAAAATLGCSASCACSPIRSARNSLFASRTTWPNDD
jgi:2-methylisocitrate lyase-like PEP mutase family enzyme